MIWTKRAKFILVSLLLSFGLLLLQFVSYSWRYQAIFILVFLTYALSAWVLNEELQGIHWLTCLVLPCFYTASVALFYFLLPEKILIRLVILIAFAIGMYAILLTENIYSIAAAKTIQLMRAAQAVGFLMTLIVAFFIYDTVFSFRLSGWYNFLLSFILSIPLFGQVIWSIKLSKVLDKEIVIQSLVLSILIGEVAFAISFWPLSILISSLFMVTFFYISVGLLQHAHSGRLYPKTIKEYVQITLVVLIITIILSRWGGR